MDLGHPFTATKTPVSRAYFLSNVRLSATIVFFISKIDITMFKPAFEVALTVVIVSDVVQPMHMSKSCSTSRPSKSQDRRELVPAPKLTLNKMCYDQDAEIAFRISTDMESTHRNTVLDIPRS
jgi:hypothetical protein